MSITITPKRTSTENDIKKGTDQRPVLKNRDIVIKRSKSTGIVLKQKKSHIGSIKHFHPRSVSSSTAKSNDSQKTVKKAVLKDTKEIKPRSKPSPAAKEEKPKPKKAEPLKPAAIPIEKESPAKDDKIETKVNEPENTHIEKQTNTSQRNTPKKPDTGKPQSIVDTLAPVEPPSCDSADKSIDKRHETKESPESDDATVKATTSSGSNEKEFSIKNGLNTPPLSMLNTSNNSDVEMTNDESKTEKEEPVSSSLPKPISPIAKIPSKNILKAETINDVIVNEEPINKKEIEKEKSSSNTNMLSLSGIKSESVPMTPSYTKSIDKKESMVEEPEKTASFLKSPKEESLDGVKLSKKASQLKKKIIQRKSKNDVLKVELNQLIENLQHLKKQYDMISTTFNDDFDDTSLKKDIDPESLLNTAMEGINGNFIKEHVAQSKADMNDIPGYYIKRSADAVFGDIDETTAYLTEPKKRKSGFTTLMQTEAPASNGVKSVNDILSSNSVFNADVAQEKIPADVGSIPLLTFDEILQPPEKKIIDFALDDNAGPGIDDKRSLSNGFDFLLDINDDLPLDDDINMDFFNF